MSEMFLTGPPKGVVLSHENVTNVILSLTNKINHNKTDLYMAHLPLAHIYEFASEMLFCLVFGARLGYSTPFTLTDRSPKIKQGDKGDASILQPTVMITVPLVLERIYKSIQESIENGHPLKKAIFNLALQYKLHWTDKGYDTPILNKYIFKLDD